MIAQLINLIETSSIAYFATFGVGTEIRKNEYGDENYPLLWMELPLLYSIKDNDDTYNFNIVLNSLVQRVEKTQVEEIIQLDLTDTLLRDFLAYFATLPEVISMTNQAFITYSGIQLAQYSDDLNGIRVEFTLNFNVC